MRIKNLFLLGLLLSFVWFSSCDDKKDDDTTEDVVWTEKTVQQNKETIEAEGMQMLDEMKAMEEEPAVETNVAFVKFLDSADPFENNQAVEHINIHNDYIFKVNFAMADYDGSEMNSMFKALSVTALEDPDNLLALYNELIGVYAWNSELDYWEYTQTGTVIRYEFPSTETGTANDASYTITFEAYGGPFLEPELEDNLPSSASAELEVSGTTLMGYYLTVGYDGQGYPNDIETSLVVGDYKMEAKASNANNADFDASYTFTHSGEILLEMTLGADGNWTEDNIRSHTKFYVEEEVWNENGQYWEWVEVEVGENDDWDYIETEFWKVVTGGNASFQAMNLLIEGQIAIEALGNTIDDMSYDGDYGLEDAQAEADAINEHVDLTLKFADSGEIIAMAEAYPVEEEDTWTDWVWNEAIQDYEQVEVTETYYWVDFRFVFADGSKIDFETYFEEGFEDLIDDLEDFADELDSTYGK